MERTGAGGRWHIEPPLLDRGLLPSVLIDICREPCPSQSSVRDGRAAGRSNPGVVGWCATACRSGGRRALQQVPRMGPGAAGSSTAAGGRDGLVALPLWASVGEKAPLGRWRTRQPMRRPGHRCWPSKRNAVGSLCGCQPSHGARGSCRAVPLGAPADQRRRQGSARVEALLRRQRPPFSRPSRPQGVHIDYLDGQGSCHPHRTGGRHRTLVSLRRI